MHFIKLLIDLVFPPKKRTALAIKRALDDLTPIVEHGTCGAIHSLLSYNRPDVRKNIISMKYYGSDLVAAHFGELLQAYLIEIISDMVLFGGLSSVVIVPMPVSKERRDERGYNQCERVIDEMMKLMPRCTWITQNYSVLIKARHTESQTKQRGVRAREGNIAGSFSISENETKNISGHTILIIDDVRTTGATLREALATVSTAGIQHVFAIALARQDLHKT